MKGLFDLGFFLGKGQKQESTNCYPNLRIDCVLRGTIERPDMEMLLDPFEEEFDVPTLDGFIGHDTGVLVDWAGIEDVVFDVVLGLRNEEGAVPVNAVEQAKEVNVSLVQQIDCTHLNAEVIQHLDIVYGRLGMRDIIWENTVLPWFIAAGLWSKPQKYRFKSCTPRNLYNLL